MWRNVFLIFLLWSGGGRAQEVSVFELPRIFEDYFPALQVEIGHPCAREYCEITVGSLMHPDLIFVKKGVSTTDASAAKFYLEDKGAESNLPCRKLSKDLEARVEINFVEGSGISVKRNLFSPLEKGFCPDGVGGGESFTFFRYVAGSDKTVVELRLKKEGSGD